MIIYTVHINIIMYRMSSRPLLLIELERKKKLKVCRRLCQLRNLNWWKITSRHLYLISQLIAVAWQQVPWFLSVALTTSSKMPCERSEQ